jgi:hypothetical protein
MHFPGSHPRGDFGWDKLGSTSIYFLSPRSLERIFSHRCGDGSKVGCLALVSALSLEVTLLYEGVPPPLPPDLIDSSHSIVSDHTRVVQTTGSTKGNSLDAVIT